VNVPTQAASRLGRGKAEIQCLTKGRFDARLADMAEGLSPRDFFYGFLGLVERGYDARFQQTDAPYQGVIGQVAHVHERLLSRFTGLSRRQHVLSELNADWRDSKVLLSFTDHFSLSLGDVMRNRLEHPFSIGLFHGLSDIENRMPTFGRLFSRGFVSNALSGLDHIGFFGPGDREEAIRRYDLDRDRTSVYVFGIDTDFWCPDDEEVPEEPFVLSVGSDPSRDYATLIAAPIEAPVHIVTRLPVQVPPERPNVAVLAGHYFKSPLDDVGLRRLYRQASVVVVSLQDVFQPTGYSVCLQAMACGRPVVLTDIKGLWSPGLYRDGEHCLLLPPRDPQAVASAVHRILSDPALAHDLGEAARAVTCEHHPLKRMDDGLEALIRLGMA
jgi:glycosyltransferase involved in cell wall biosynthesis